MNLLPAAEFNIIVTGAFLLSANAGFINVVSIAGIFPGVTVSHVTGTTSRVPISLLKNDFETFALVMSILVSFCFGSFVGGFMVGDEKWRLGKRYGSALALETAMLFASFLLLRSEFVLGEWCAAFAMGLQNAMCTAFSGMAIRTTHMTGCVTDIGNILGQYCRKDGKPELWRLKVLIPIFVGFIFGGFIGQLSWMWIRDLSLLIPVIFTGLCTLTYFNLSIVQNVAHKAHTGLLRVQEDIYELRNAGSVEELRERGGVVNQKAEEYKRKLEEDIRNFMGEGGIEDLQGEEGSAGGKGKGGYSKVSGAGSENALEGGLGGGGVNNGYGTLSGEDGTAIKSVPL